MITKKTDRSLDLDSEQLRSMVDQAMIAITRFIDTLEDHPAIDLDGASALARSQVEGIPEKATPFGELLEILFGSPASGLPGTIDKGFNTAGPGYLAYIPGGGLLHAAVADLIADAVNRYVGVFLPAPALTQIETNVIRWFCSIVGYPASALGFLTSGGSMANLSAVITARTERLGDDHRKGIVYCSSQTHHSLSKAVRLAGIPAANLRSLPVDAQFRIRPDCLVEAIRADRQKGLQPFLVVGNAGTTNTGAVDPLVELADIVAAEELWFHVDAAYGGFFSLTQRGREALRGLDRADSMVLDPHKSLFLPYGTGCLLVRDRAALYRTFSSRAEYLPQMQEDSDCVDFCEISPELSRDFRGLRVCILSFRTHLERIEAAFEDIEQALRVLR